MADARDGVGGISFESMAARSWSRPLRLPTAQMALSCLAGAVLLAWAPTASAQGPVQNSVATGVGSQFEMVFWQSVDSGSDPALYEAYLSRYPNGTFAEVARVKLVKLRQAMAASTVPANPVPTQVTPTIVPAPVPTPAPPPMPAPTQAKAPATNLAEASESNAEPAPVPAMTRRPLVATATPGRGRRAAPSDPEAASDARASLTPASVRQTSGPARTAVPATPDPAPFVTAAVPTESAADSDNSAALRRLLGALGDSQRPGMQSSLPVAPPVSQPVSEPVSSDAAGLTAQPVPPAMGGGASPAAPGFATSATVTVPVPDAAALSASAGQASDPHPIAVGPLPTGFALPPRPALAAVPGLTLPGSFCSPEARNAFHDGPYISSVEAAKHNNDAAIAYMHQLQDLYDRNQLSGDINPQNAVAAEARAYSPVAAAAFAAQSALVNAFHALMAVPIIACEAPK